MLLFKSYISWLSNIPPRCALTLAGFEEVDPRCHDHDKVQQKKHIKETVLELNAAWISETYRLRSECFFLVGVRGILHQEGVWGGSYSNMRDVENGSQQPDLQRGLMGHFWSPPPTLTLQPVGTCTLLQGDEQNICRDVLILVNHLAWTKSFNWPFFLTLYSSNVCLHHFFK